MGVFLCASVLRIKNIDSYFVFADIYSGIEIEHSSKRIPKKTKFPILAGQIVATYHGYRFW